MSSEPITEEKRQAWREHFTSLARICFSDPKDSIAIRLLDALEAAEAERDELQEAAKRLVWRLNKAGESPASKWFDSLTEYATLRDVVLKGKGDKEE